MTAPTTLGLDPSLALAAFGGPEAAALAAEETGAGLLGPLARAEGTPGMDKVLELLLRLLDVDRVPHGGLPRLSVPRLTIPSLKLPPRRPLPPEPRVVVIPADLPPIRQRPVPTFDPLAFLGRDGA